jgi:hypothetical protein
MNVKATWVHWALKRALSVGMAVGMIGAGISLSPGMAAGSPPQKPNCGGRRMTRQAAINMSGTAISVSAEPISACPGDSVLWKNSNRRQSYQIAFTGKDPFQKGGTYTVPAGKKLMVNIPSGAVPGTYQYSVCAKSCSATGMARLDPHVIIM